MEASCFGRRNCIPVVPYPSCRSRSPSTPDLPPSSLPSRSHLRHPRPLASFKIDMGPGPFSPPLPPPICSPRSVRGESASPRLPIASTHLSKSCRGRNAWPFKSFRMDQQEYIARRLARSAPWSAWIRNNFVYEAANSWKHVFHVLFISG